MTGAVLTDGPTPERPPKQFKKNYPELCLTGRSAVDSITPSDNRSGC
jgi:hypothetical protein